MPLQMRTIMILLLLNACDIANVTITANDATACAPNSNGSITVSTTIPGPVTFTLNGDDIVDGWTGWLCLNFRSGNYSRTS